MWIDAILIIILIICVTTDLKSRKIYNKVIFPGLLIALLAHWALGGWASVEFSGLGFLTGLGLLFIPYLLGGMGPGDVKLLALIGALKGTYFVLVTAVYMSFIGAFVAIIILLLRKGTAERITSLVYFLYGLRYGMKIPLNYGQEWRKITYPYGTAIAGGSLVSLLYQGWL